jgi:hypothetical protein
MPDTDNGRVTLAVVQNEIKHTRGDIQSLRRDIEAWQEKQNHDHEELEHVKSCIEIIKWAGTTMAGIVIALTIAAIKQWLGL